MVDEGRTSYKQKLVETMADRNKYRDMIASRKDKERILTEILVSEKIDLVMLQAAIEAAIANKVDEKVVLRGKEKV